MSINETEIFASTGEIRPPKRGEWYEDRGMFVGGQGRLPTDLEESCCFFEGLVIATLISAIVVIVLAACLR